MFFLKKIIKQPTILIFDSGVGGLSVYNHVRQLLPYANYLYLFDNEGFPYGEKSEQFINCRSIDIISVVWNLHDIDLIIIACNTVSITSLSILRNHFPCKIIGVVPAIKLAARITSNGIIGLLATHTTLQHQYTYNLVKRFAGHCQILKLKTQEMVEIAEAKLYGEPVKLPILRKLFQPWKKAKQLPDTVVLGCTHFPLLTQELKKVLPESICLVDSGLAIARRAVWLLQNVNKNININNSQNIIKVNKAYCTTATPRVMSLIPTLMHYGFYSLEQIKQLHNLSNQFK